MQQQQHHQDEEDVPPEEEEESPGGHLYEEEQYQHEAHYVAPQKHAKPAAQKKGSSKKKKGGNYQTMNIRPLNPPGSKKEPIYSQTVAYKGKGASSKGGKGQKARGQGRVDLNAQRQQEMAHNHIVNMDYGEGIQEVDEDPVSENEIMPKIEDSQGDEEQASGKDNQIYDVLSDNVKRAKQNLRGQEVTNRLEIKMLNSMITRLKKVLYSSLTIIKLTLTII